MTGVKSLDLGVLTTRRLDPLVLGAPSRVTRVVWLMGAAGCLVFLWSVASSIGWLEPGASGFQLTRAPTLFEAVFWLPPLLLAGFSLGMALGGVKLSFREAGLDLRSQWPSRGRMVYSWSALRYARFWEEPTPSREQLYAMRFVFSEGEVTVRVSNRSVWLNLREQFTARGSPHQA